MDLARLTAILEVTARAHPQVKPQIGYALEIVSGYRNHGALMSISQTARILGCDRKKVRALIAKGLPVVRLPGATLKGDRIHISRSDLSNFIQAHTTTKP